MQTNSLNTINFSFKQRSFVFSAVGVSSFIAWPFLIQMEMEYGCFLVGGERAIDMKFWIRASGE